jgi:uncharacterized short protein YbdD (DUF466 family)
VERANAGPGVTPARIVRGVRRYVHAVMGDDAYRRYLDHMRRAHPDAPVLSERAYWRDRHAAAESDPRTRCC